MPTLQREVPWSRLQRAPSTLCWPPGRNSAAEGPGGGGLLSPRQPRRRERRGRWGGRSDTQSHAGKSWARAAAAPPGVRGVPGPPVSGVTGRTWGLDPVTPLCCQFRGHSVLCPTCQLVEMFIYLLLSFATLVSFSVHLFCVNSQSCISQYSKNLYNIKFLQFWVNSHWENRRDFFEEDTCLNLTSSFFSV